MLLRHLRGATSLRVVLVPLLGLLAAATADAANVLPNPTIDEDIDGWASFGTNSVAFSTADELGSEASGSLELRASDVVFRSVAAVHCVPVVGGRKYVLGAAARFPAGQNLEGPRASVSGQWSSTPNCSALDLDLVNGFLTRVEIEGVWGPAQLATVAPPGALSLRFEVGAGVGADPRSPLRVQFDNLFVLEDESCAPQDTALCLTGGRFRVSTQWRTKQGQRGYGHAVALTADSGYFWFFNAANVELVTKLIDACPTQFDRFWFFAAGLTNVEVVTTVADTEAMTARNYVNMLETPFQPVQDTNAFATCP